MMRRIIINIILITLTAMTIACHFITIIINYYYSYYNISLLLIVIEIIISNIITMTSTIPITIHYHSDNYSNK